MSDIDDFINEKILGYPQKNIWDDNWMIERDNENTSEWPKGTSESELPSTEN